jgi:thiocyanate hydrolase subunit gamma
MSHTHKPGDGGAERHAAPMVEEVTDFEVLEIAVRELAIEHGLFTAEDHRRFTEWTESVGPAEGSRLVAKAWTDPALKLVSWTTPLKLARKSVSIGRNPPDSAPRAAT